MTLICFINSNQHIDDSPCYVNTVKVKFEKFKKKQRKRMTLQQFYSF